MTTVRRTDNGALEITALNPRQADEMGLWETIEEEPVSQHLPNSDTKGLVVPGVPDCIERTKLLEFLAYLGVDYRELVSFTVYGGAIEVEMYALNEHGSRYFILDPAAEEDKDRERVAIHRLSIPIR